MIQGDEEVQYFTREQALATAEREAQRNLEVTHEYIRYVALVPEWSDYCLCEFFREEADWVKVVRVLKPDERLPGEEITDEQIVALARSGRLIDAIRLYRAKHDVGLIQGKLGVEALLDKSL